jgi:predicted ferric reductase
LTGQADSPGVAALAPLGFLVIHSLPILRRAAYELFVKLHVPVSIVFLVMLFWHTKNALATWDYLYATVAVWASSWLVRPFFLNWTKPGRVSFLVGDDATVTLLPENAVKVTISTQVKWKPGQYVYLRMPGVAATESHPFTVASLCSDDLPSEYGEGHRDMILVLRPFAGFTRRLAESAATKGPYHVYRAFVDGPYGGTKRRLESFDSVVLIAGGSGITALVSQLLDLIKRMRDGKAITRSVRVVWALRRPETLEWFKEELRICRECAPPEAVRCQFFITAAKRWAPRDMRMSARTPLTQDHKRLSMYLHDGINDAFQSIADRRASYVEHRMSKQSYDEGAAAELKRHFAVGDAPNDGGEDDGDHADALAALTAPPRAHVTSSSPQAAPVRNFSKPMSAAAQAAQDAEDAAQAAAGNLSAMSPGRDARESFGFAATPTEFRKNIMRFAFLPQAQRGAPDGWSTEYGRPDLTYMLREMATSPLNDAESVGGGGGGSGAGLAGAMGRRTAVFVCGPPSMRVAVSRAVAALQTQVLRGRVEEVFLHTENYAL